MKYLSVCSGIEAASVAWHPLGWTPYAFAEIEKFPSEVLAHHYGSNMPGEPHSTNGVPNYGDITKFAEWPEPEAGSAIDVLVGGTPCQSFSVAGLRKGIADPRGNLSLVYLGIVDRFRPRWVVYENVPGILSSWSSAVTADDLREGERREVEETSDFGCFVEGLRQLGYGVAWRVLDAQFVRVDGAERAVPQRRERVFVVGHIGDWRRSAAVLFDGASLRGDPAPRRKSGERVAGTLEASLGKRCGQPNDHDPAGGLVVDDISHCLNAGGMGRQDWETETFVACPPTAATLTRGAESSGKGGYAGRRQEDDVNLVAEPFSFKPSHFTRDKDGAPAPISPPLSADADKGDQDALVCAPEPYTLELRGRADGRNLEYRQDGVANALRLPNGGRDGMGIGAIATQWAVRRLTPLECERLQSFPDGYTNIPRAGGKDAADGPRYKALGNSMATNVMRWIGRRIEMVDAIKSD